MKENLNNQNKEETEGAYEQFDTDDTFSQDKMHKKINLFSSKKLIKYILMTFVLFCLIFLLFNLTQNKNISNNLEFKSNPKELKIPLEKDEFKIKNEVKLIENKMTLNDLIKGTDIINGNQEIILITVLITINNKCLTSNCFDCYINQEINYPELSDEEAFDKIDNEIDIRRTYLKGIYYNPKMTKRNNGSWIHGAWNKYKRKMIYFKGVNYFDRYTVEDYNNEYLQAFLQGYEFTIIDNIYEKNNKNYKYNNITLKFDEIKLDIKCQRKGDNINYPELSDKEAFDKVFREMDLRYIDVKNVYKKYNPEKSVRDDSYLFGRYFPQQKYYVWNNYKREMILLKEINYFYNNDIDEKSNNEYLQSAIQGYKFTSMEHIYEKDKKYYKYNESINIFDEIKLDSI